MCIRCARPSLYWSFFVHTPLRFAVSAGGIAITLWYAYLTICPAQSEQSPWPQQGMPAWVDALGVLVGAFLSAVVTLLLIHWFRPNLILGPPYWDVKYAGRGGVKSEKDHRTDRKLKIPVENCDLFFAAANLRIEVALVRQERTVHLDLDRHEFIMLSARWRTSGPEAAKRTYHVHRVNRASQNNEGRSRKVIDLVNEILVGYEGYLRVRVHASHEFTGFGRAFEARFKYDPQGESFTRMGCGCK